MSSRSSHAASRHSTPSSDAPGILTPSRKVQALLAQFSDSDSDADVGNEFPGKTIEGVDCDLTTNVESETDEDDDDVQPQGRLAARLLGGQTITHHETKLDGQGSPQNRELTKEPLPPSTTATEREPSYASSSDDELIHAAPTRKRKRGAEGQQMTRPASPLFFPSPNVTRVATLSPTSRSQGGQASNLAQSAKGERSRFSTLVDKHRRERMAREAAEIAKRAAGLRDSDESAPRRPRGSSPADDSGEDTAGSDNAAVRRIQRQARPTRKASKRAIEEMNKETQRMNRNMQLAHQATTRKKITKESLFLRFNFQVEPTSRKAQPYMVKEATPSTSATASDAESSSGRRTTPPTSPLRETERELYAPKQPEVKDITHLLSSKQIAAETRGALAADEEPLDLSTIDDTSHLSSHMQIRVEYLQNDVTVVSPKAKSMTEISDPKNGIVKRSVTSSPQRMPRWRAKGARLSTIIDPESDDEIEIVKDRGLTRKYAAFELLPKRKAKEMPSHLALRSLAHLFGGDEKKRAMNAAELQLDLKKKARVQAHEERRQKIELLKSRGIVVQTIEEREQDQQEVEDLVERARQEAVEIQKREKELAKKDGTYVKDELDEEEDASDDGDFEAGFEGSHRSESDDDDENEDEDAETVDNDDDDDQAADAGLIINEAIEEESTDEIEASDMDEQESRSGTGIPSRTGRKLRVISDDEDEVSAQDESNRTPKLPPPAKTPQSIPRSMRKMIPGLQMSDDLPMGLSQAFAATMAESQTQDVAESQEQDSLDLVAGLPSPRFSAFSGLHRLDSIDVINDSQPSASQTQPLNVELVPQSQVLPESPFGLGIRGMQHTPSQRQLPFDLTQDNGYIVSPFKGNRFDETPTLNGPTSTVETIILPTALEDSPVLQRRGRLQRGRVMVEDDAEPISAQTTTAFQVMKQAMKQKAAQPSFDKKKSGARGIVDDAAEESEDEYAGLGGASDDSGDDEENEDDRRMIDEDTQVGRGDEAKLAGLFADRERERDEKEVSKLLKDISTGALRRKRGVGDDLDLSDEEDAAVRKREAKRREFARMRRELLKDEAVGKIAEDKKKEAFLRSIEDRDGADAEEDDLEEDDTAQELESQSQSQPQNLPGVPSDGQGDLQIRDKQSRVLSIASDTRVNRLPSVLRRTDAKVDRRPATLAEIRESVSFLIEEPESQAGMVDLGLSDSEEEAEAYVDLDRHFKDAEVDEHDIDQDMGDLGDFVVDDEVPDGRESQDGLFKKPDLPRQERAPFSQRRTKHADVVDRLSLLRQASSSASSTASTGLASTKMAFISSKTGSSIAGLPSLLRRATTNSSLGSMSGRDHVSATGVVTSRTERGSAGVEKEFIRKGNGGRRNAVNYQAERKTLREEKMSARAGVMKASKGKKGQGGFLGALFRGNTWD